MQTDSYLLTCLRYIELNPIRAGMVLRPVAYPWSSYRAHAHGHQDALLSHHPVYEGLGRRPVQSGWPGRPEKEAGHDLH